MVMELKEAQGVANEALRAIATNPDFNNLKDVIGRELDITDEILDEAVKVLFSKPAEKDKNRAAVLITRDELKEWVTEELEELVDEMPPDSVVEDLVDRLAQHFGNDQGQWIADNLKSFFGRDDVLKVVE
jgi:hypothetical protein